MLGWKQAIVPYGHDAAPIQEALFAIAMAQSASTGKVDRMIALYARDDLAMRDTALLLSPAAAAFADRLPGEWRDVQNVEAHRWEVLYTAGVTMSELGLTPRV